MSFFYGVNKEVLPLKANLAIQQSKLEKAEGELAVAQAELDAKEAELNEVRKMYEKAMAEKQALQDDADSCKRRMEAAKALISGLSGERERWTEQSKEFEEQLGRLGDSVYINSEEIMYLKYCLCLSLRLVGDVLLASAFLSYSGPFNQEFRTLLLESWKKELQSRSIPFSRNININEMLSDPVTVSHLSNVTNLIQPIYQLLYVPTSSI